MVVSLEDKNENNIKKQHLSNWTRIGFYRIVILKVFISFVKMQNSLVNILLQEGVEIIIYNKIVLIYFLVQAPLRLLFIVSADILLPKRQPLFLLKWLHERKH